MVSAIGSSLRGPWFESFTNVVLICSKDKGQDGTL